MLRAGYSFESLGNRIVIDDRLQRDGVVGVDPERDLLVARAPGDVGRRDGVDVSIEARTIAPERAVVDETVAHVQVERLVERLGWCCPVPSADVTARANAASATAS